MDDLMMDKTKEEFQVVTKTEQEIPVTISQSAANILADEKLNLNRKMNPDLPAIFQIDVIDVMPGMATANTMSTTYNRMRIISTKMAATAWEYRRAAAQKNIMAMQARYAEAEALYQEFYDPEPEMEMETLNKSEEEDNQLPPETTEIEKPKPGYFARKKAEKQKKKAKEERENQLEKEYGEQYRSTADMKQEINFAIMQNDYVKELVLPKKTIYKENGKEVETTQSELLKRAEAGDYSHLEQLEPALRNVLAAKFMKENKAEFTGDPEQDALALETRFKGGLMQPLLRLGISLGMRQCLGAGQQTADYYKKLDAQMNAKIMQNTLAPFRHQDKVGKDFLQDDVERNQKSQLFIAKTMLMCHMGTFTLKDKNQNKEGDWEGPVANAFAHCSRVGIVLPGTDSYSRTTERKTIDSYTGEKGGLEAGFFVRGAATHTLFKKSKDKGLIKTDFEEKKWVSFFNQRGMNVAVGGLGNNGITGPDGTERILKNDGSCGHIYMHLEEADRFNYTSMLVGFESDSYKKTNQLGHTHGFGNGEFASSFGGQRLDEIGDKYGGRHLDLTKIKAEVFQNVMEKFENSYMQLQKEALSNAEAMAKLEEMNKKLCGARMSKDALKNFIRDYMPGQPDMSDDDINSLS